MCIVISNRKDVLKLLLTQNTLKNLQDGQGFTALHIVLSDKNGYKNNCVNLLLDVNHSTNKYMSKLEETMNLNNFLINKLAVLFAMNSTHF